MSAKQKQSMPPPLPHDSIYTSCYCEENVYLLAKAFASKAEEDADWPWQVSVVFISNHGKTVALWNQKAREGVVVWDYHVILVLRSRDHMQSSEQDPTHREDGERRTEPAEDGWVYDFDTRLTVPSRWTDYVSNTFPYVFNEAFSVPLEYQRQAYFRCFVWASADFKLVLYLRNDMHGYSLFRVVPAAAYLDYFASDRSHMLSDGSGPTPHYTSAPPSYPTLCGIRAQESGIINNLMDAYVSMVLLHEPPPLEPEIRLAHKIAEPRNPYGEVMGMPDFLRWLAGETGGDA
ncbi:N-terminal glutamine amidase-domain-containing protein [Fomitopsis serialis]|uniref:N-terminal glutamine amidase-domain-containing protein n=1 Tax=Fomitopsis serialis TaxID=139415 RepID=UPI002008C9B0|nr:N-terminal glutamine amidase-domain-containing protein [Neoantrodia serialis]KAH9926113.1 N-terminal glutamine amidase-domain-containing protein [Neoantrodia serialis]